MLEHEHQWSAWYSNEDRFGLLSPDDQGIFWRYKRECDIMGCHEIQYAEFLVTKGKTKYMCDGVRTD